MRGIQFTVGIILFVAIEILRVYFIMPFPGSQESETIEIAYFLHENIFWLRTIAILIFIIPAMQIIIQGRLVHKILVCVCIAAIIAVFWMANYKMQADKMFSQPTTLTFSQASSTSVKQGQLVLGVVVNGIAKAYPINMIGYHHQVRDEIAGEKVMITYCTVCRTGRAFKPLIDGREAQFRLVGMDHFNAMFEDTETGSWWRQVTGEAIAGPLRGKKLEEIQSYQMTLGSWLNQYPTSEIMNPDPKFANQYERMLAYDKGEIGSDLVRRDNGSWNAKSWVVGVSIHNAARAYDWKHLEGSRVINDTLSKLPIAVILSPDSSSFRVFTRDTLVMTYKGDSLIDLNTQSVWAQDGKAVSGKLSGVQLQTIQSYQEFWHSWKTFHPETSAYPLTR